MTPLPRASHFDSTLALLRDPYRYIARQAQRLRSDVFQTRLLFNRTICMTGPESARLFSEPQLFERHGAAPLRLQLTLFGSGGVQTLDGPQHRHRKQMFLSMMTPRSIESLVNITMHCLRAGARRWSMQDHVVLYDALQPVLTRAVCDWACVPLPVDEVEERASQLMALFDYAGHVGPKHWRARQARLATEHWIAGVIEGIRQEEYRLPEHCAAYRIAWHRDTDGELLSPRVAAVELLNILRPTVAISVYLVFIAHALHEHPDYRRRLFDADDSFHRAFVHEVRRLYPFFPATPARVREQFEWRGHAFPAQTRVMLDLHGVNHDPRVWDDPEQFRPERFGHWDGSAFNFVPQGAGDHLSNHRCPGEWITIALMTCALRFFVEDVEYVVPEQDLRVDYRRLPALPRSRFIIERVRLQ